MGSAKIPALDFSRMVTLYSDHNLATFLTESTPKSTKLMGFAVAIQEYDVTFRYRSGALNVTADCLKP
jgi:hypothetical protein